MPYCYDDFYWNAIVYEDTYCDSMYVPGTDGDCANYYDFMFEYGNDQYFCPSAERLGRAVTYADCSCVVEFGDCTDADIYYPILFDLSNDFFSQVSGSEPKTGLVSTTVDDEPFYTTDDNPKIVSLGDGDCDSVSWTVYATGSVGSAHTFFAFANLAEDNSITDTTSDWEVSIV